jgi:hypothetical protein
MGTFGNRARILDTAVMAVVPTALDVFNVRGNQIVIDTTVVGAGSGVLHFTAEVLSPGSTVYSQVMAGDIEATWTTLATTIAGTYRLGMPGLHIADGDNLRLSYWVDNGVGTIQIFVESFEAAGADAGVIGMAGPLDSAEFEILADVVSLTDGGAGYPFTGYLPDADGRALSGKDDVVVDLTITGGAGAGDDITARVEFLLGPGAVWADWTLSGMNARVGATGFAGWTSVGGGAAVSATPHFDNANAYAVRVAYDLLDASGAVRVDLRRERGDA